MIVDFCCHGSVLYSGVRDEKMQAARGRLGQRFLEDDIIYGNLEKSVLQLGSIF